MRLLQGEIQAWEEKWGWGGGALGEPHSQGVEPDKGSYQWPEATEYEGLSHSPKSPGPAPPAALPL